MHLFDLRGITILVTGSFERITRECVISLLKAGARVIVTDQQCLECLPSMNVTYYPLKRNDPNEFEIMISFLEQEGEEISVWIYNQLTELKSGSFFNGETSLFSEIIEENILNYTLYLKTIVAHMKRKKVLGSIVNLACCMESVQDSSQDLGYLMSRVSLCELTRCLSVELTSWNIRINTLVASHSLKRAVVFPENQKLFQGKDCCVLDHKDLDFIILYLSSYKASKEVTGTVFSLDGRVSRREDSVQSVRLSAELIDMI